ncbi:MAG: glycosyl hydrolase family 28-related protein [Spirosomataceae bacterium]
MKSYLWLICFLFFPVYGFSQATRTQTKLSIDSLLPPGQAVRIPEIRKAFEKALSFAESNTADILKFGANPNGTTNTTAAVQAAIATGKKLYIPKGTYLVNSTFNLTNNIECEKGAVFKVANNYTGDLFTVKSQKQIVINGLTIDATGTGVRTTGLKVQGLWNGIIDNFSFRASAGDTVSIGLDIYSSDPTTMSANPFGAYTINVKNAFCAYGKYGIRTQKTPGDIVAVTHLNVYGGWFSTQSHANISLNDTYQFNIINPAFDSIRVVGLKLNNCHQGFFRVGEYNSGLALNVGNNCSLIDFETALTLMNGMVSGTNYTAKTADRLRLSPTTGGNYYTEYRSLNDYNAPFSIVGKPGGGSEITYLSYQAEAGLKPHILTSESSGSIPIGLNASGGMVKMSSSKYTEGTSAPVGGTWHIGDFCKNLNPVELGNVGSKYVIEGWFYLSDGWVQKRFLTGN